ncbi:hypothetical protein [Novipirellula rosea]|uniref:Secreted protein n=1 Tax=Novipirellula rosea TaxID=1031540 RepID=A0ABP8NKM7_9BACT|tara:strand:- start:923 stop:1576 length:654 start_codon:yes stop_codon:yes gene_type:complete
MKKLFPLMVFAAMVTCGGSSYGQAHDHSHGGDDGHSHGDHDHSGETLAFQLPQWKTMHFEDANKAAQHLATVQQLGCEAQQDQHAGHIDIAYRSPKWRSLSVKDHAMADQWARWLKASGFDVSHAHTAAVFSEGAEIVEFRMVDWKQIHGSGSAQETQTLKVLQDMGCEVVVESHGDHRDIRFRAPTWRDIHLVDHNTSEQWASWLQQNGFEARHSH